MGKTLLFIACSTGHENRVKYLIEYELNTNKECNFW